MGIFNFTKKKELPKELVTPVEVEVMERTMPNGMTKSEFKLIKEIHNEFDTAQDRLYAEATEILTKLKVEKPTDKAIEVTGLRLQKIGFVNSPIALQSQAISTEKHATKLAIVKTESDANLIQMYKNVYPFLKFLTVDELNRICKKYGLVYAPVKNYIKDVPEKNIKMIEDAQPLHSSSMQRSKHYVTITKFWHSCPNEVQSYLKGKIESPTGYTSESEIKRLLINAGYTGDYNGWIYNDVEVVTEHFDGLFICAPKSHFDLTGLSENGVFGFLNITKQEVKDPIVFRYCNGGVQVLSKWGLEASDEALLNPIDN